MVQAVTDSPLIRSSSIDKPPFSNFMLDQITPTNFKSIDGPLTPASFNMKRYPESEPLTPEVVIEGSVAAIGFAQFSPYVSAIAQSPAKVQSQSRKCSGFDDPRASTSKAFKNLSINSETPTPSTGSISNSNSSKYVVENSYPIGPSPMTPSSFGLARWPTSENETFPVGLSPMNNAKSVAPSNLTRFASFSGTIAPNTPLTPANFGLNRWPSSEQAIEHLTPLNKSTNPFFPGHTPRLDCIGKENIQADGPLTPASFGLKSWPSSEFAVEHLASAPSTPQISFSARRTSALGSSPFTHLENKVPLSPATFGLKRFPSSESAVEHLTPSSKISSLSRTLEANLSSSGVETEKINEGSLASIGIQPYSPYVAPVTQSPIFASKSNCELPFSPTFAIPSYPSISDGVSLERSSSLLSRSQYAKKPSPSKDNLEKDSHPRSIFDTLNSNNQQLLSQSILSESAPAPTSTILTVSSHSDLTSCILENPLPSTAKPTSPTSIKGIYFNFSFIFIFRVI